MEERNMMRERLERLKEEGKHERTGERDRWKYRKGKDIEETKKVEL